MDSMNSRDNPKKEKNAIVKYESLEAMDKEFMIDNLIRNGEFEKLEEMGLLEFD